MKILNLFKELLDHQDNQTLLSIFMDYLKSQLPPSKFGLFPTTNAYIFAQQKNIQF